MKAKRKRKYFTQLFITYSAAFLLLLTLLFSVTLLFIYREQYSRNAEIRSQLVSQIETQMDSSLESMDRIATGLIFNRNFIDIMADSSDSASPGYEDEVLSYFLMLDAPDISTYRIIAFNDSVYYTMTKSDENPAHIRAAAASYHWEKEITQAGGEKVILPVHPDSFSEAGTPVYSLARSVTDGKHVYGIVEIQNEYSSIESICALDGISGQVSLFAPDGTRIYPRETDGSAADSFYRGIYDTVSARDTEEDSFFHRGTQIAYSTSGYSGWTVVLSCSFLSLVPFGVESLVLIFLVFLCLAGTALILFRILTRRMVAPLNDLNRALKDVSLDNLSLELPRTYNTEEIESINQSFQKMFSHLRNAINVSIQSRANEERANYLALQSQMNPHTIYNTISMIEGTAYMNNDREVCELCIRFSKMLRYISDFSKDIYSVGDEVAHLNNYAFLIQKRYEGKMDISVHADPALLGEQLPKFTLQPLVENCVNHGFSAAIEHFTVTVRISGSPKSWRIRIEDNGSGFTEESLSLIAEQLARADRDLETQNEIIKGKIGKLAIGNIYIRCRILFRDRFRFTYGNLGDISGGAGSGAFIQIDIADDKTGKECDQK